LHHPIPNKHIISGLDETISGLSGADARWAAPGVFRIYGALDGLFFCLSLFHVSSCTRSACLVVSRELGLAGLGSNDIGGDEERLYIGREESILHHFVLHIGRSIHSFTAHAGRRRGRRFAAREAAAGKFDDITRLPIFFAVAADMGEQCYLLATGRFAIYFCIYIRVCI
jgi:hypothetical protein